MWITILSYCRPTLNDEKKLIEEVQNRICNIIHSARSSNYQEELKKLVFYLYEPEESNIN